MRNPANKQTNKQTNTDENIISLVEGNNRWCWKTNPAVRAGATQMSRLQFGDGVDVAGVCCRRPRHQTLDDRVSLDDAAELVTDVEPGQIGGQAQSRRRASLHRSNEIITCTTQVAVDWLQQIFLMNIFTHV